MERGGGESALDLARLVAGSPGGELIENSTAHTHWKTLYLVHSLFANVETRAANSSRWTRKFTSPADLEC